MSALVKQSQTIPAQDLLAEHKSHSVTELSPPRAVYDRWSFYSQNSRTHFCSSLKLQFDPRMFFPDLKVKWRSVWELLFVQKGLPKFRPNRIHKGLSNIKLKLLSLEILDNRINWHAERTRTASVHRWQQTLGSPERRTDEDIAPHHHCCRIPLGWSCLDVRCEPLSWAAPRRAGRAWILGQDLGLVRYSSTCCQLAWG